MSGLETPEAAEHFDAKYRSDRDPWRVTSSWYERRKYAVTMASLPRERYRAVWEPGCGIGELTALLGERADAVDAADTSRTAVDIARGRLDGMPGVTVRHRALPAAPPRDEYDLVVMSEVLYYLSASDREDSLQQADRVVGSGELVVVHWRHHPADAWSAGAEVNEQVRARPGWVSVTRHEESDFVLDVVARR